MSAPFSSLAAEYVRTVNAGDVQAFQRLFAEDAVVHDAGHTHRGLEQIKNWSEREIFAVNVSLEPTAESESAGETVLTTKVDGTFDKTGLPDPLFINQHLQVRSGKIVELACRLAVEQTA
ncbi:nuclear transport factor 2 family protein [Anatilimnocola sp. NA78]|uniref:nuclear transport factor 2 family protein n=1 Tax=Anatilimnocola sp. NA78 TaxID=3415683 RepID=UPI003CE597A5